MLGFLPHGASARAVLLRPSGLPGSPSQLCCGSSLHGARTESSAVKRRHRGGGAGRGLLASGALAVAAAGRRRRLHQVVRRQGDSEAVAENDGSELLSDLGIDYSQLRDLLKAQDFKAADAETRSLLIKMSGEEAVKRGWIYFAEVKRIPENDMSTLEDLWQVYSEGKFGFAQQRKIWKKCRSQFDKFAEEVSWFTDTWKNRNWPDEFIYSMEAPAGHLPLTNCIRGAQVLQELLDHPAVASKKAKVVTKSSSAPAASDDNKPKKRSALSMLAVGRQWPITSWGSRTCLAGVTRSGA